MEFESNASGDDLPLIKKISVERSKNDKTIPIPLKLSKHYQEVIEKIKTKLKPGSKLLFVSVAGSHAKRMNSPGSDYDCHCIILHSEEEYMVQKVTKSKKFEYDDMLEGTFTDLVTAYEYALATNPSLYEALEGIVLLKTPIIQELE